MHHEADPSQPHTYVRGSRAAWTVDEVTRDTSWIYRLSDEEGAELLRVSRAGYVPGKPILDYRKDDFPLDRVLPPIAAAFKEVRDGRGMALVKGLPREAVSPEEFELMTWVIGLHFGVARPQDRTSSYLNKVKDVGVAYRSPTGRGYSSNSQLDFHVDGSDIVLLSCYNQAPVGGMSMCTSSVKAFEVIEDERPDLARELLTGFPFSRNGEERQGEPAWVNAPIYGFEDGQVFCVWNRNRVENAQKIAGVPALTGPQREAIGYLDAVIRRPDLMLRMHLEPGDLQLLSNQTVLHSRTYFEDHPDDDKKRTLFRLWLAMPDSLRLPAGWQYYTGSREPGTVRGGSKGLHYDDRCLRFDREQAQSMGMRLP
ncbi:MULTISPECIES: TauD/TfdA family dioxygenase [Cupriavidus]